MRMVVNVLKEVNNWETLSGWLDEDTNIIKATCFTEHHGDLALCFRMSLVRRYCDTTARTPRQVADDMADVLENRMRMKKQADKLRHLELGKLCSYTVNLVSML